MSNFEKIKNMTLEEMADFLNVVDDGKIRNATYCRYLCTNRGSNGCLTTGEDDPPCFQVTDEECVKKWLESDVALHSDFASGSYEL